ncbi:MAG: (4Fe-4S)-binding protein [Pseudomonadota bacterium]
MANEFKGKNVTISYDENVCTHAGKCVGGNPTVFNLEQDPWIQPGDISYEDANAVVQQCPSGALKLMKNADTNAA